MSRKRRWPWIAKQRWHDILFIHWPIPYEDLRAHVPKPLLLETYDGYAWVSVVLFQATNSSLRGMPDAISYRSFLQLNARTYVKFDDEPGVYFFSLDANSKLAVAGARLLNLPYLQARMNVTQSGNEILFVSNRTDKRGEYAKLTAVYCPLSKPFFAKENTVAHFLTERYCIWMIKGKKIYKAPISHQPWQLQSAELNIKMSGLFPFLPHVYLQPSPLAHYSKFKEAYLHPFERQ